MLCKSSDTKQNLWRTFLYLVEHPHSVVPAVICLILNRSRSEVLNHDIIDFLGWIVLFIIWGCPVHCRMFNSTSGLFHCMSEAVSASQLWWPKISPGLPNVFRGIKLSFFENCWHRAKYVFFNWMLPTFNWWWTFLTSYQNSNLTSLIQGVPNAQFTRCSLKCYM